MGEHKLIITGIAMLSGGLLQVSSGTLKVGGDFRVQSRQGNGYTATSARMDMNNAFGVVGVEGSFVMQSSVSSGNRSDLNRLSAGRLEVERDFIQLSSDGASEVNFRGTDTHRVVLDGNARQTVSFEDAPPGYFNNVTVSNQSTSGIYFDTPVSIHRLFDHQQNAFSIPFRSTSRFPDFDNDGIEDPEDAFPQRADASDPEEYDVDGDGVPNDADNCPSVFNANQLNADTDENGNACDTDDDNDGLTDEEEIQAGLNPLDSSDADADTDGDGFSNRVEIESGSNPLNANSFPNAAKEKLVFDCTPSTKVAGEIYCEVSIRVSGNVDNLRNLPGRLELAIPYDSAVLKPIGSIVFDTGNNLTVDAADNNQLVSRTDSSNAILQTTLLVGDAFWQSAVDAQTPVMALRFKLEDSVGEGTEIVLGISANTDVFSTAVVTITADNACDSTLRVPSGQWVQISLPCQPPAGSQVSLVLGDDIPGAYGQTWKLFKYLPGIPDYLPLEADDLLTAGTGYWLKHISGKSVTLDMPSGSTPFSSDSVDACASLLTDCASLPLFTSEAGNFWSMLGVSADQVSAFEQTLVQTTNGDCDTGCTPLEARALGLTADFVWVYKDNEYQKIDSSKSLQPWEGFWAIGLSEGFGTDLRLLFPRTP